MTARPADQVAAFRGRPAGKWFLAGGEWAYIDGDGGYATVTADTEDTGHLFADVTRADGSYADGGCWDSLPAAQRAALDALAGR